MKLKSYLRGLGLGMIVTTIILVVTFKAANHEMTDREVISRAKELGMVETSLYANGSEEQQSGTVEVNTPQETTKGEESGEGKVDQEATTGRPQETTAKTEENTTGKQNTTTAAPKPQETTKREEPTTAKPQETTAKREEPTTAKPQETTAKREEPTTAKPQETTAKQEETTAKPPNKPTAGTTEIVLEFENITSADKASRILYEAGVIQDIDSFNNYLTQNGYERKVGEGTFTFTKGMSFEEIAKIITRSRS